MGFTVAWHRGCFTKYSSGFNICQHVRRICALYSLEQSSPDSHSANYFRCICPRTQKKVVFLINVRLDGRCVARLIGADYTQSSVHSTVANLASTTEMQDIRIESGVYKVPAESKD